VPAVEGASKHRAQPVVQSQTSSSSSASSDSYTVRTERKGGGRRRRRKRGESEGKVAAAALADVDSGYVNGEESSSEQNSDKEDEEDMMEDEVNDSGMEVEQEITELLIHQMNNPESVDVQFGEVAEILEQLKKNAQAEGEKQEEDTSLETEENILEEVTESQVVDKSESKECEEVVESDPKESEEIIGSLHIERKGEASTKNKKSSKKKDKKNKKKAKKDTSLVTRITEDANKTDSGLLVSDKTVPTKSIVEAEVIETNTAVTVEIHCKTDPSEPTGEAEEVTEDKAAQADAWTEVNASRKKKSHHVTFSQTVNEVESEAISSLEKETHKEVKTTRKKAIKEKEPKNVISEEATKIENHKEIQKESLTTTSTPLKEIKDLFFQDKPVEIVELVKPESMQKTPKKRTKPKTKSKRAFLSDANKANMAQTTSLRSNTLQPRREASEPAPLPFLVFQPFSSFLQEGDAGPGRVEADWQRMVAPPIGLCVPSASPRPTCPLEEQLVASRLIPRRESLEVGPTPRPVVMVREYPLPGHQLRQPAKGAIRVPGPRLQYSQGCRSGPLGVTRKVVPPLSLTQRLTVF